jgi:hypothetical protein
MPEDRRRRCDGIDRAVSPLAAEEDPMADADDADVDADDADGDDAGGGDAVERCAWRRVLTTSSGVTNSDVSSAPMPDDTICCQGSSAAGESAVTAAVMRAEREAMSGFLCLSLSRTHKLPTISAERDSVIVIVVVVVVVIVVIVVVVVVVVVCVDGDSQREPSCSRCAAESPCPMRMWMMMTSY